MGGDAGQGVGVEHRRQPVREDGVDVGHGYTLSMDSWHFQRRHLQDRFGSEVRMVFYDQCGHGLSGKRKLALAAIWLGVFVGLALLIERFAT